MRVMPEDEPLIAGLKRLIHMAMRLLAILMVAVIFFGVADVVNVIVQRVLAALNYIMTISDLLATFGAFLAVLIAVEIFVNITIYLREDVFHVPIVIATALMAIARKVIILDFDKLEPIYIFASASAILALAVAYWMVRHTHAQGGVEPRVGGRRASDPRND